MPSQETVRWKGGTMRLGAYPCRLREDSLAYQLYGETTISERHRHRYEVNNEYRQILSGHGLSFSGTSAHFGDPRAEVAGTASRWPARLGGVVITYTGNVCRASCDEFLIWRYGDPEPSRMSMAAYGWNSDSTSLVLVRGTMISR
jgi:hypothetical protein